MKPPFEPPNPKNIHSPSDDYAEVGTVESDPCFEARVQNGVVQDFAHREKVLFGLYKKVYKECGSGKYNLNCVVETFFADRPRTFLKNCMKRRGPEPVASGAVCRFAKVKVLKLEQFSYQWGHVAWIMDQAEENCEIVPFPCVYRIRECMDAPDINWCFRECIRNGNMKHALLH